MTYNLEIINTFLMRFLYYVISGYGLRVDAIKQTHSRRKEN